MFLNNILPYLVYKCIRICCSIVLPSCARNSVWCVRGMHSAFIRPLAVIADASINTGFRTSERYIGCQECYGIILPDTNCVTIEEEGINYLLPSAETPDHFEQLFFHSLWLTNRTWNEITNLIFKTWFEEIKTERGKIYYRFIQ